MAARLCGGVLLDQSARAPAGLPVWRSLPTRLKPDRQLAAKAWHMSTLVLWDFDWSLCNENTDTFVIREIGAWDIYEKLKGEGLPWTALMDATLATAHTQLGVTEAVVRKAVARTPLDPAVAEAIRKLAASGNVESVIISDANSFYIDTLLVTHNLEDCFSDIYTNPAEFLSGALRVHPYHAEPPGCHRLCPVNLCKGQVVRKFLARRHQQGTVYNKVVYVGDGRGDYCPVVELQHSGLPCLVLARSQYPDGVPCALWVKLRADRTPSGGPASVSSLQVVDWGTPAELAQRLTELRGECARGGVSRTDR